MSTKYRRGGCFRGKDSSLSTSGHTADDLGNRVVLPLASEGRGVLEGRPSPLATWAFTGRTSNTTWCFHNPLCK